MIDPQLFETIDFEKQGGLIPAIVQDVNDGTVLMLAYMSRESLQLTLEQGLLLFSQPALPLAQRRDQRAFSARKEDRSGL